MEINILKEKLNKERNSHQGLGWNNKRLDKNSLKQQPIQSQSFTSDSDENHHISTVSPFNYKKVNFDNTNMNISTMNDDLRDKSTDIFLKNATIIQYWSN